MPEQTTEEKIKMLIDFVDDNFRQRKIRDVFRVFLPAFFILVLLIFLVFLMLYQWTNISLLNWTPGLVSIVAILIAFNSYVQSSVRSINKSIVQRLAAKLRLHLADKSDETFYLLIPLVALKHENYPLRLSTLYHIDRNLFKPEKLTEYYFKSS
jgi:hypothetical protein